MNERLLDVPLYIFDEHNHAFFYWQKARIEGHLTKALDLFHIDAHDDMAKPVQFRDSIHFRHASQDAELDYFTRFARTELNIANFIFPAALNGLLRNVYFVFPKWRKFKPARRSLSVCSAFGEGKVLKYTIKPDALTDPMVAKTYSDLKKFNYFAMEAGKLPKNRDVILDIDMDYFACRDSIYNQMSFELEITREQFINRDAFLAEKSLPFSGLDFTFHQREESFFVKVERKKSQEHFHLPPEEEIKNEIEILVNTLLEKNIKPRVVTICRSCFSGYCPGEYSHFIEDQLVAKLKPLLERAG
jgi:hypothetical protein